MSGDRSSRPDWRDGESYQHLLGVEQAGHAWEWLRRDPDYQAATDLACRGVGDDDPAVWGLVAFEPWHRGALEARPLWRAEDHSFVLVGSVTAGESTQDGVRLASLLEHATSVMVGDRLYALLSDGRRSLRLDLHGVQPDANSFDAIWHIRGIAAAQASITALKRLAGLARTGMFTSSSFRPDARARRLTLLLRAYDGMAAGADQREIAAYLLDEAAGEGRWRVVQPGLRAQVQRLMKTTRSFARGGWRALLR